MGNSRWTHSPIGFNILIQCSVFLRNLIGQKIWLFNLWLQRDKMCKCYMKTNFERLFFGKINFEILRDFITFRFSNLITISTYVLMDKFCTCFLTTSTNLLQRSQKENIKVILHQRNKDRVTLYNTANILYTPRFQLKTLTLFLI